MVTIFYDGFVVDGLVPQLGYGIFFYGRNSHYLEYGILMVDLFVGS